MTTDPSHNENSGEHREEKAGKRPGEAAAFLVTIVLLVAIALLGVSLWKTIDGDFKPAESAASPTGPAEAPAANDPVVMTVDGMQVRESEFGAMMQSLPEQMRTALANPGGRDILAEELVKRKVLERYAREKGLARQPQVAAALAVTQGEILATAALRDKLASLETLTPRQIYDQNLDQFETLVLSQIVVPYEGSVIAQGAEAPPAEEAMLKAAAIAARVRGGEDFAAVARAESADAQTAAQGGRIGEVGRGALDDDAERQLFSLPVGGISEPVRTPFGIHVFRGDEKKMRSFEELEEALTRSGRQLQLEKEIDALMSTAKVDYNPEFFPNRS
ncbi:MAG: peptidylprolyl isomerase [Thermoanaerobaculia bacterium]